VERISLKTFSVLVKDKLKREDKTLREDRLVGLIKALFVQYTLELSEIRDLDAKEFIDTFEIEILTEEDLTPNHQSDS
jgi:hypothetical protein